MSSFATQRIKSQAQADGVTRHLESIGNTRFASICRAGHSIHRNLPSIKKLVDESVLFTNSKVCLSHFRASAPETLAGAEDV